MREIHLLYNAHLDPVWLWEWPEGAAEALQAADAGEQPGNMPSGESFVRQIQWGRRYFRDKFGVRPQTAANLDSFGHSRRLVQILARAGYRSYLFCRPRPDDCPLPGEDFAWVGYDGSWILAHRPADHYNSPLGQAVQKITRWIARHPVDGPGLVLWGVGNHGGGPSRADLEAIARYAEEDRRERLLHSSAEAYLRSLQMLCQAALRRLLPYPRPEMEQALYDLLPAVELSDSAVQMSAFSPLPGRSRGLYLIRLYEPTGRPRSAGIRLPAQGIRRVLDFGPFEVKTLLLSARLRTLRETNLLGER
jgi:hypothetical protein